MIYSTSHNQGHRTVSDSPSDERNFEDSSIDHSSEETYDSRVRIHSCSLSPSRESSQRFHPDQQPLPKRLNSASRKRTRRLLTQEQSNALYKLLEKTHFPSTQEREVVARELGISSRKVQVWFQNRRQVGKKRMMDAVRAVKEDLTQSDSEGETMMSMAKSPTMDPVEPLNTILASTQLLSQRQEDDRTRAWREQAVMLAMDSEDGEASLLSGGRDEIKPIANEVGIVRTQPLRVMSRPTEIHIPTTPCFSLPPPSVSSTTRSRDGFFPGRNFPRDRAYSDAIRLPPLRFGQEQQDQEYTRFHRHLPSYSSTLDTRRASFSHSLGKHRTPTTTAMIPSTLDGCKEFKPSSSSSYRYPPPSHLVSPSLSSSTTTTTSSSSSSFASCHRTNPLHFTNSSPIPLQQQQQQQKYSERYTPYRHYTIDSNTITSSKPSPPFSIRSAESIRKKTITHSFPPISMFPSSRRNRSVSDTSAVTFPFESSQHQRPSHFLPTTDRRNYRSNTGVSSGSLFRIHNITDSTKRSMAPPSSSSSNRQMGGSHSPPPSDTEKRFRVSPMDVRALTAN